MLGLTLTLKFYVSKRKNAYKRYSVKFLKSLKFKVKKFNKFPQYSILKTYYFQTYFTEYNTRKALLLRCRECGFLLS